MSRNLICTPFELKNFAFSLDGENPTASNFASFIESKSRFKYTVIEIDFLIDAFKLFEEQANASFEINKNFHEKWKHLEIPKIGKCKQTA